MSGPTDRDGYPFCGVCPRLRCLVLRCVSPPAVYGIPVCVARYPDFSKFCRVPIPVTGGDTHCPIGPSRLLANQVRERTKRIVVDTRSAVCVPACGVRSAVCVPACIPACNCGVCPRLRCLVLRCVSPPAVYGIPVCVARYPDFSKFCRVPIPFESRVSPPLHHV